MLCEGVEGVTSLDDFLSTGFLARLRYSDKLICNKTNQITHTLQTQTHTFLLIGVLAEGECGRDTSPVPLNSQEWTLLLEEDSLA